MLELQGQWQTQSNDEGQLSFVLSRLFRPCVVLAIARLDRSEIQLAVGQYVKLVFFFAMRSRKQTMKLNVKS